MNSAAVTLLMRKGASFQATMAEGAKLIAGIAKFDRISIFRNADKPDGLHTSQVYRWLQKDGGTTKPLNALADVWYSEYLPNWDAVMAAGKCVNGPVRYMKRAKLLRRYGLMSVFAAPIEHEGAFWGFVAFEDIREERYFTTMKVAEACDLQLSLGAW